MFAGGRSISKAFAIQMAVTFICLVAIAVAFMVQRIAQSEVAQAQNIRNKSFLLAEELRHSSDELTKFAQLYSVTGQQRYLDHYNEIIAMRNGEKARPQSPWRLYWDLVEANDVRPRPAGETKPLLVEMREVGFPPEELQKLEQAKNNSDELIKLETRAMNAVQGLFQDASGAYSVKGPPDQKLAAQLVFSDQYMHFKVSILKPVDEFFGMMDARTSGAVASATALSNVAAVVLGILVAMTGALLVAIAVILSRRVIGPMIKLRDCMEALAQGKLETSVPFAAQRDEVGAMAQALLVFKGAVSGMQSAEDAERQRALVEQERESHGAVQKTLAAQQSQVVEEVALGLQRLASGDLRYRLEKVFAPDYEKLRADFNGTMEQLQQTMTEVAANAETIRSGTSEISTAADDLSRRTEQQAASLEETAAALDEITTTVNKTAEGARHARDVVSVAKADAEKSGAVVRTAVEAMSGIEKSSKQIGQIVGVIDEIAFQTNLLALNAGVEAARAGDAGRGFAVVASEVRALAQRSAEAAKEIKGLISTSTSQVDYGVKLVTETGQSLQRIMTQVTEINEVVSEIAAGAKEQATGLGEVNTAINQMDQVTQQNAAMVEETSAAAHSLGQETEGLSRLLGRFQIDQAKDSDAIRHELQKLAPHAFRQPAKLAATGRPRAAAGTASARPLRAATKAVANGAAANDKTGGWEEF
ncbi:methyl-accepting chemotaxis protein [Rhizobiales bacterium GAS188]|nr:methyl-accepting chemotaxis protein [Rhizobiales bacterium GAS188]